MLFISVFLKLCSEVRNLCVIVRIYVHVQDKWSMQCIDSIGSFLIREKKMYVMNEWMNECAFILSAFENRLTRAGLV